MKKYIKIADKLSFYGAVLAAITIFLGMTLILVEVVVRSAFRGTTYIANEYAGYAMVLTTFLGLGYTLSKKGHVRMNLIDHLIKGKARQILELVLLVVALCVSIFLDRVVIWHFTNSVSKWTQSMYITQTPLAYPEFFIVLGCILFTLQVVAEIFKQILKMMGKFEGEEEVASEFI